MLLPVATLSNFLRHNMAEVFNNLTAGEDAHFFQGVRVLRQLFTLKNVHSSITICA